MKLFLALKVLLIYIENNIQQKSMKVCWWMSVWECKEYVCKWSQINRSQTKSLSEAGLRRIFYPCLRIFNKPAPVLEEEQRGRQQAQTHTAQGRNIINHDVYSYTTRLPRLLLLLTYTTTNYSLHCLPAKHVLLDGLHPKTGRLYRSPCYSAVFTCF